MCSSPRRIGGRSRVSNPVCFSQRARSSARAPIRPTSEVMIEREPTIHKPRSIQPPRAPIRPTKHRKNESQRSTNRHPSTSHRSRRALPDDRRAKRRRPTVIPNWNRVRLGMSDYLPEEIVLEILQRLPVKSLIRFRCISKSWNSLITSSAFINSHLTRSLSLPSNSYKLIVRHCPDNTSVKYFKLIDDNNDSFDQIQNIELPRRSRCIPHFELIGSANGLFSLFEKDCYIIWNPSIRKFITLPKPCSFIGLCRHAFGYDARTNDYKVVRIAFPEEAKPPLIDVYSLNEGCWRITSASFPPGIKVTDWYKPAASLNGAVHFAVEYKPGAPYRPLVLSFDLRDEVFHVIPLPNVTFISTVNVHTSVIGGSLSLLFHYDRHAAIWVMKEYGVVDSWTKQFTVHHNRVLGLQNNGYIRVLGLQKNGNILVEAILSRPSRCELSSYDPKSEQVKNLWICRSSYTLHVDNYMENLGLLDKPNETVFESRVSRKRKCSLEAKRMGHQPL